MFPATARNIVLRYQFYFLPALAVVFLFGCQDAGQHPSDNIKIASIDTGRQLMLQYCNRCHLLVEPDMLNKKSWTDHVLPAMAPKLGMNVWGKNQYYPASGANISLNDWLKLVAYYKEHAPDTLKQSKAAVSPVKDWFVFNLRKPAMLTPGKASTLMVAFDTSNDKIYTCDDNNDLYQWNLQLKGAPVYRFPSPAVNVTFIKQPYDSVKAMFTLIGTMQAIDDPLGALVQLDLDSKTPRVEVLADKLLRPVEAIPGDFNKDGLTDWVVCGFGHNYGGLYLLQQTAGQKYLKKIIREVPGAIQAITGDFDHDGWPDIICLFAHAEEGIWLFTNDRHGGFTSENLLRFNPAFGSTSIQLADFNRDGLPDILYTCGDNSDYSMILKPFHGIYIFMNEGNNKFKQSWFYPVNGCTKAIVADFDMDGNPDIAAIAFFADLKNNPSEKFICFQQDKPLHFIPHSLPIELYGRWICMNVNDYDHDGDPDIILGNYSKGFINQQNFEPDWDVHIPFVVLENVAKKKYNKKD